MFCLQKTFHLDPEKQKEYGCQNERYIARKDVDPKNDTYKIRGPPKCEFISKFIKSK